MTTLFSANACPFAQRTRALLEHLDAPFEMRQVDLENRDPELLAQSPTGKVPFLVDGDVRLFESGIINDYLAEKLGFEGAYALDPETRALQKLVMRRWDDVVVPAFYRSMGRGLTPDDLRADLERELAFMADTVAKLGSGQANLPSIHLATHWSRMHWLREFSPIAELIDEHPTLRGWLDGALALPTVQSTLPDRDAVIERYRRRFFGEGAKS